MENPFIPNSNLWQFYERASAESKPAIKTSTEQIIATPKEPDKINTQQKIETNNKITVPNVKIKEEASSVVTPANNSSKENVDLLKFGKSSQLEKIKEKTDNIVTPTILKRELKVDKERNYNNKSTNISVEDGALQSDEFSTNTHNYSQIELSNLTTDSYAKRQIMDSSYIIRDVAEAKYRMVLDFALSDDDNLYERVTNAFLKGEGLTTIYDNGKELKALILDENSITSIKLKHNPTFKDFMNKIYLERIKESIRDAENLENQSDTTSFESNLTKSINSKVGKDCIVYHGALNFSKK
ncbi:MAG: hypothetical protein R3Y22_00405 [Bacteroidales bacterium]